MTVSFLIPTVEKGTLLVQASVELKSGKIHDMVMIVKDIRIIIYER